MRRRLVENLIELKEAVFRHFDVKSLWQVKKTQFVNVNDVKNGVCFILRKLRWVHVIKVTTLF